MIRYLLCFSILFMFSGFASQENSNIRVITFNIRYDNPRDSINAWPHRASMVTAFLNEEKPDLFGLQEALWHQYLAIDSALTGYSSVAVGRDDGKMKGETNPVFFKKNRFEKLGGNTFWLSSTPQTPGTKGWGASLPRVVTWVELMDKADGKKLFYFNTHFAHDSDSARIMSAKILLNEVKRIAGNERFVITGDFNMGPDSRAYSIITEAGSQAPFLKDTYNLSVAKPEGPSYTTNGWSDKPARNRIDYVFVKSDAKALVHRTIIRKSGPVFISDHWPVETVICF